MNIQKWLSTQGVMSRRAAIEAIKEKRIHINGELAIPGQLVQAHDKVEVDGRLIRFQEVEKRVLLYHKPCGRICSNSAEDADKSIWRHFPPLKSGKWVSVGRLDINTSGLMLVTTDGELANWLMHPSSNITRTYRARVAGAIDEDKIKRLLRGVRLEDGPAKFEKIKVITDKKEGLNTWFEVTVLSGRYRMVRRLFESQDWMVNRLIRVGYGPLILPKDLRTGSVIELPEDDIAHLRQWVKKRRSRGRQES